LRFKGTQLKYGSGKFSKKIKRQTDYRFNWL